MVLRTQILSCQWNPEVKFDENICSSLGQELHTDLGLVCVRLCVFW